MKQRFPNGFQIALLETTAYEGDAAVIKHGARVIVWYRSVGEQHPPSPTKFRVLPDASTR